MLLENKIWVGTGSRAAYLLPQMANRHGLIAGATGTGKTVSLKVLAEGFSEMGVPVFLTDIKGDLSGMVMPGEHSEKLAERLSGCGVTNFCYQSFPTVFWDVYGEQGHPIRATISEMGPLLLSRMLGLNETQTGVLNVLFRVADDEGMLLLDIKDLRAMLAYLGEHARDYTLKYGNVSVQSIGAIQRAVAVLEGQGGDLFFGEPALNIADWIQQDETGKGVINILSADKLFQNPTMYSTFLLWMLSELYEILPEQGDAQKPRIVFFFDEAHLLFNNCSRTLMEKIEQVVRLIRSKGVGVYFITQSPTDIPMSILGQLGNRIQHALRAYTPIDQKAVKVAAQTFRVNPEFDTEQAITGLKTGEALVSFLDADGAPCVVDRATVLPPQSFMGAIDVQTRNEVIAQSPFCGMYEEMIDRESAYEVLSGAFEKTCYQAAQPVKIEVKTMSNPIKPQGFMVFNPQTGQYEQKQIPTMTPVEQPRMQAPVMPQMQPQQPVMGMPYRQPMMQSGQQIVQMPVMMFDQATGQYRQQMMTMQFDPATGGYMPIQQPQPDEKSQKEAARKAKEMENAARRARRDELAQERADRARRNDSVAGRVKNTAIHTATREVTRQVTRGILGGIQSLFGKKR